MKIIKYFFVLAFIKINFLYSMDNVKMKVDKNELGQNLITATKAGDIKIISELISLGADLNEKKDGNTALMIAVKSGFYDIAKLLIKAGSNVDETDYDSKTILMWAIQNNFINITKLLLDSGAKVDLKETGYWSNGYTALMYASNLGNLEIVKLLLKYGANINEGSSNQKGNQNESALMIAVSAKQNKIINFLIEHGANINLKPNWGHTALMRAAENLDTVLFKTLCQAGADVINEEGLVYAAQYGKIDVVKLLLDAGTNVNVKFRDNGSTAILYAARSYKDILKLLLDKGANVNHRSLNGRTALMEATDCGHEQEGIVKMLIDAKADLNLQDNKGNFALINTVGYQSKICRLLLAAGANPNLKNNDGETALMKASFHGQLEIVKMLIYAGAKINQCSKDGSNELMWNVCVKGNAEIFQLLLDNGANIFHKKNSKTVYEIIKENINYKMRYENRPDELAQLEKIKKLIEENIGKWREKLFNAINNYDLESFKIYIKKFGLYIKFKDGNNLIHYIIDNYNFQKNQDINKLVTLVAYIISFAPDLLSQENNVELSPIKYSLKNGKLEIFNILLSNMQK